MCIRDRPCCPQRFSITLSPNTYRFICPFTFQFLSYTFTSSAWTDDRAVIMIVIRNRDVFIATPSPIFYHQPEHKNGQSPGETICKKTGRSPIKRPWMNQRRIPADNADVVHRDMSLDSFNLHTRTIWGMLEKVVSKAAIYPIIPNPWSIFSPCTFCSILSPRLWTLAALI